MENLIVIEGKEKYQYKNIKDLVEGFINKDYYNMSKVEKRKELEKKAYANTIFDNIKIQKENFNENAFIIYDEITYILSLLRFNKIVLLEKTEANIFCRYINKEEIEDNYIIVNKFANEITKKYLEVKNNE